MHRLVLFVALTAAAFAGDFVRELPNKELLEKLTPEKFTGKDAVVIVKEVSYNCEEKDIYYSGLPFKGMYTTMSHVTIAKLFNEAAVDRYGTVEFSYEEPYGNDIRNAYELRIRVLKPDGSIKEVDDDEIHNIVMVENAEGEPFVRKVICKIPNLAVNDVVQIEYGYSQVFTFGWSQVFAYNEPDPVLFSNLYITLPAKFEADFYSFPEERIGKPQQQQISKTFGSGKTYFWSVKNLNGIRNEPYSIPFMDQALITAFVVSSRSVGVYKPADSWAEIGRQFSEYELDKDDLRESQFAKLGFTMKRDGVTMATADSLYSAIRKFFTLNSYNVVFPESKKVSRLFDRKKGDASDLSYIMLTALHQWKQEAQAVFLRDRRQGQYEVGVPTMKWFDRLGVLVSINGVEKLYDFDESIPEHFVTPWFLKDITVGVIAPDGVTHRRVNPYSSAGQGTVLEQHTLSFDAAMKIADSMTVSLSGGPAQHLRQRISSRSEDETQLLLKNYATAECLSSVTVMDHSDIRRADPVRLSYSGPSHSTAEQLDAFLTLRLRNDALKGFHNALYSTARRNDVQLDEPVTMTMEWTVLLPKGYAVSSTDGNRVFTGPGGSTGVVRRTPSADKLLVKAEVVCPQTFMPYNQYPALMKLLDDVQAEAGKDVVLKKL